MLLHIIYAFLNVSTIRTVKSGLIRSHSVRKESYDTMPWYQIRKAFRGMAMLKIKRMY